MSTRLDLRSLTALPALCLLLSAVANPVAAADVETFRVIKGQQYTQDHPDLVALDDHEDPFFFLAHVFQDTPTSVTSASVQVPGGDVVNLQLFGETEREYEEEFDILLDLNTKYGNGTYIFTINTQNEGQKVMTMSLTGDAYPTLPRLSNYTAAQTINAASSFQLTWDAFAGGTTTDLILLYIEDAETHQSILETGEDGIPALNGTSTAFTIPAGTLQAGKDYEVELIFAKVVDLNTQYGDGVVGASAYARVLHTHIRTTGGTDSQPPYMWNHRPFSQESNVDVKATVCFEFDEPMNSAVHIAWTGTGINPANFTYTWSPDGQILFASYAPNFPLNTEIGWTLNPSGSTTMRDVAGNPLPQGFSGTFTTSNSGPRTDPDVENIVLVKGQSFIQTGASPVATGVYAFQVFGDLSYLNAVTDGTVTTPNNAVFRPENDSFGTTFDAEAAYASKTDLDRFFPNGTYQVSLNTVHDGNRSVSLTFPADNYPNNPTVSNLASLQALDPTQPFTINWGSFVGASADDFVDVIIENEQFQEVFESDHDEGSGLNGNSTSIQIPANTLSPGRKYYAKLTFAKIVAFDDTTYPGAEFVAAFGKETEFEITTSGTPIQPQLSVNPGGGTFNFFLNLTGGEKRWQYRVEATDDLILWAPLQQQIFTYDQGTGGAVDYDSQYLPFRAYRAKDADPENRGQSQQFNALQGHVRRQDNSQPIAGAVVSTSLDGRTAKTDANGNFFLQTGVEGDNSNQNYTITITRSGFQTFNQNQNWGNQPRGMQFQLNPL
jgi:hypothetical protein